MKTYRFISAATLFGSITAGHLAFADGIAAKGAPAEVTTTVTTSETLESTTSEASVPSYVKADRFRLGLGLRTSWVADDSFGAISTEPWMMQLSIDAAYTFLRSGRIALSAGGAWDVGGRSGSLRGLNTSIAVHRLSVPLEARWAASNDFYAFFRVAPGFTGALVSVEDPSAPATLKDASWAFSTDVSLGASLSLANHGKSKSHRLRTWVTPELGYGFALASAVRPTPGREEKEKLGSDESLVLGKLSMGGAFFRIGLSFTY